MKVLKATEYVNVAGLNPSHQTMIKELLDAAHLPHQQLFSNSKDTVLRRAGGCSFGHFTTSANLYGCKTAVSLQNFKQRCYKIIENIKKGQQSNHDKDK